MYKYPVDYTESVTHDETLVSSRPVLGEGVPDTTGHVIGVRWTSIIRFFLRFIFYGTLNF